MKQNRNRVVGIPRKRLEEKAIALADQGEWTSLVAINIFLAYHHSKESLAISVLANAYDTFDLRCEKSSARIICCTPALYVWLVSHFFHESRPVCPLQGHRICAEKWKANWEELLAGMIGVSINWFPVGRKEGPKFCAHVKGSQTSP